MRRTELILVILSSLFWSYRAECQIHHWEAVVNAGNTWRYMVPTGEPSADWIKINFDDTAWPQGPGGFGFGDGDDGTIVSNNIPSVYLRKKFTINSVAEIEKLIFLADFDDGYVAYLNGKELSRSGMTGTRPAFSQLADSDHEALRYQGSYPASLVLVKNDIPNWLVAGENILAIQVHNLSLTSSDLTSNFYLNVGLSVNANQYQAVETWFQAPAEAAASTLPLVIIDTQGRTIVDEPKITATMGIIDNGPGKMNRTGDAFTGYNGRIGIEIRGSSSQMFPQKQYAIELKTQADADTSASILGMPREEDWILQGPYTDKSLMRNVLTYKLGNELGWYAPRTRFCEFYLNNEYRGVYFMTEKIKRDKNRVNISELNPDENTGDDLTGGYIVKIDKTDGANRRIAWTSPYTVFTQGGAKTIQYQYHYPAEDVITSAQGKYIQNFVTSFEGALLAQNFRDPKNGYRKYINVDSFIDFAIMNELTKNVDGYRLSTFLYKDRDSKDGKLHLGPLWDFNLAFGNADYCEGGKTYGWAWDFNDYCANDYWVIPFWWDRLMQDRAYVQQFRDRWFALRSDVLSNEAILTYIDSVALALEQPQKRHYQLYPILNQYVWPNNYIGGTYANEIAYMKSWITERLSWLDSNIGAYNLVTGLDELVEAPQITVFPNPTSGAFNIQLDGISIENIQVEIIDQLGEIYYRNSFRMSDLLDRRISLHESETNLRRGLYLIRLSDEQRLIHSQKIVVN